MRNFRTFGFALGFLLMPHGVSDTRAEEGAVAAAKELRVTSFSLIDTETQKPIKHYEKVTENGKISIGKLPTKKINVRANVEGEPGSVRFMVPQEKVNRVENKEPFSLAGDLYGRFLPWDVVVGKYSLAAVPYTDANAKGTKGEHLRVDIEFTD